MCILCKTISNVPKEENSCVGKVSYYYNLIRTQSSYTYLEYVCFRKAFTTMENSDTFYCLS